MAKKQKLPDLSKVDPLEVLDLSSIGTDQDCFGHGYDLSTKECRMCGDSELCCIRQAQLLGKTRKQLESENNYKDLDTLEDVAGIKKYMRTLKRKGNKRKEIISKTSEKYEVPTKILREIYREIQ